MCLSIKSNKYDELKQTNSSSKGSNRLFGKKVSYRETNDYFRSLIDFTYNAKEAGFSVYPFVFDKDGDKKIPKKLDDCFNGPELKFLSFFAKDKYDRLVLICSKKNKCLNQFDEGYGEKIKFGIFDKILIYLNLFFNTKIFNKRII